MLFRSNLGAFVKIAVKNLAIRQLVPTEVGCAKRHQWKDISVSPIAPTLRYAFEQDLLQHLDIVEVAVSKRADSSGAIEFAKPLESHRLELMALGFKTKVKAAEAKSKGIHARYFAA